MATRHESTITQWLTDVSGPGDAVDALALLDRVEHGLFGAGAPRPTVGRYVLGRMLGRGGFGRVYEADDPELARRVAVKLVAGEAVRAGVATDDFLLEARALARVRHPHCVAIHDVGRYALVGDERCAAAATDIPTDGVYIVMELVRGQPLGGWLAHRPVPEVLAMFEDLADALAAAHRVGVIHGDFKPANVAVDEDGCGRVLDFGLARLLEPHDGDADAERRTIAVGTPRYMAYELHCGVAASRASDQFAWAAALCEALGGELPYAGDTPEALAASKARGLPPQFGRALPGWLTRLLARALACEPSGRFADMDAVVAALRRARTRSRRRRLAAVGTVMAAARASALRCARPARRCRRRLDGSASTPSD